MNIGRYFFSRKMVSTNGFVCSQRPSTDSLNALSSWANKQTGRSFVILDGKDDEIFSKLKCHDSNQPAGHDLDTICNKFGIQRTRL